MNLFGKIKGIFFKKKETETAVFDMPTQEIPEPEMVEIIPPVPIMKKQNYRFHYEKMIRKQKSQQKNWSKWKNKLH